MYFRTVKDVRDYLNLHIGSSLSKNLVRPVEVGTMNGPVVVNRIARNSINGRIRLFGDDNKPIELAHCTHICSPFNDYAEFVNAQLKEKRLEELRTKLSTFQGKRLLDIVRKCNITFSEVPAVKAVEYQQYLEPLADLSDLDERRLLEVIDFCKDIERFEYFYYKYNSMSIEEFNKLDNLSKAQYWYLKSLQGVKVAHSMKNIFEAANRFKVDYPVLYDVWFDDSKDSKEVSDTLLKYGYCQIWLTDSSSACSRNIMHLMNEGWKLDCWTNVYWDGEVREGTEHTTLVFIHE